MLEKVLGIAILLLSFLGTVLTLIFNRNFRRTVCSLASKILKKKTIADYFNHNIPDYNNIDIMAFQFGLRERLPIVHWLYLEYIKLVVKEHKIKNIFLFPVVDDINKSNIDHDLNEISKDIEIILKDLPFEIIHPKDIDFTKDDLLSSNFISTLQYIGSNDFFDFLRSNFKIKIKSTNDFYKLRKKEDKIKYIFIHTWQTWGMINYIKKNVMDPKKVKLSTIFWEMDITRFGVIKHYAEKKALLFPLYSAKHNETSGRKTTKNILVSLKICNL